MKEGAPSETALRVAANMVSAALDPELRRVIAHPEEPYCEWFVRAFSPGARFRLRIWKWGPTRRLLYRLADARLPGAALHLLLRKRFVEDAVTSALAERPAPVQVVVFAGGLDPLALRLAPRHPDVSFVEIDHPATQEVKRRALREHGLECPNLTLLPVDFNQQGAEDALRALPGFRPAARRLFLAEGLLMYLEQAEVDSLFACVRRNSAPGSRCIFSVLDQSQLADPESSVALAARVLATMGEPIKSSIERRKLDGYLRKHGLRARAVADHRVLRKTYLASLGIERPLSEGELLVEAETL